MDRKPPSPEDSIHPSSSACAYRRRPLHNRATHLIVRVGRSRRRGKCRRKITVVSSSVAPHRYYTIRIKVVTIWKQRVTMGAGYSRKLYMPGNETNWTPVPGLHLG
jgi:hypothetical protein